MMRLSEDRIEAISLAITDRLASEEFVDLTMDEEDLAHLIGGVIAKDLKTEDDIQREAVEWIAVNRKHLETGTTAWQIEMENQRELLAVRRGYTLP
jgi:hypothetical protein